MRHLCGAALARGVGTLVGLAIITASCGAPDRWSASTTYGRSSYDGFEVGDRDGVSGELEVGVSGPLGKPQEPPRRYMAPEPYLAPATPTPQPEAPSAIPWESLILLLSGAAAGKAGDVGYKKLKRSRQRE